MPSQIRLYIQVRYWSRDEQYEERRKSPMQAMFVKGGDGSPLRVNASFNLNRRDGSIFLWLLH